MAYGKKFTYEFVRNYFEEQGCEMLEKEYKNNRTKMKFKCFCGEVSKVRFFEFKKRKKCKKCGIKQRAEGRRLSYEYVRKFFEEQGCELIEKEYKNNRTKMKFKCFCGNASKITFSRFQQGCRCMKCGNKIKSEKQKLTYEYVKQYFKDRGCELLEKEYINRYISMEYRCTCGNILKIFFDSFQQKKQGEGCSKCKGKKYSGEKNYRWIKDRKIVKENEKFRHKCYQILKKALKRIGQKKNSRTKDLLGYTAKEMQNYIYNHSNWENVKDKEWHLDHVFPIKAFTDYNIKDVKLINSLDNLQPLLKKENLIKSYKYDKDEFESWLKEKKYEF